MAGADEATKKKVITDSIRGIPDFPHAGILFWDVTTIMLNPVAFQYTIDLFTERYKGMKVDVVAGKAWSCSLPLLAKPSCLHRSTRARE